MKKKWLCLALILSLCLLLLAACAYTVEPTTPTVTDPPETVPVGPTLPPETVPATTPETVPQAEYPIPGEPMDEETLAQWQAYFDENAKREAEDFDAYYESDDYWQIHWRTRALCSYYASPELVNIPAIFHERDLPGEKATEEEIAWVYEAKYGDRELGMTEVHRYPAEKVDLILQTYFGLTLENTYQVGLYPEKNFLYNPKTDCYYAAYNDALTANPQLLAGYTLPDGKIALVYVDQDRSYGNSEGEWLTGTLECFTVLEPQENGTYHFLCNLPVNGFDYYDCSIGYHEMGYLG